MTARTTAWIITTSPIAGTDGGAAPSGQSPSAVRMVVLSVGIETFLTVPREIVAMATTRTNASKAPPYMHRIGRGPLNHRGLFAQIKLKTGEFLVRTLDTRDPKIARARIVPMIEGLVAEGKLDRGARVCRLYRRGCCPTCGRGLPT